MGEKAKKAFAKFSRHKMWAQTVRFFECPPGRHRAVGAGLTVPARRPEYILCREDRMVSPAWSRLAARQRLGVTARELDGGHSPFLAQPAVLADELLSAARAHSLGNPP